MQSNTTNKTKSGLSVMTLAIMNITAVVSLRGLATEAIYGIQSAFYYLFAAIVFLIPTAMVAAELAAMFSAKQGGVFRWVGEAFGARTGFLAIWLQWIQSTIWYPTVLTFGAVSIAYIGVNPAADAALTSNRIFTLVVVLAIGLDARMIVQCYEIDAPAVSSQIRIVLVTDLHSCYYGKDQEKLIRAMASSRSRGIF